MTFYSIILSLHILTVLLLIGTIIYADHLALAWIRGKKETLPPVKMTRIHHGVYLGLGSMMATGFLLFWPSREFLLSETAFQIKMGLLLVLMMNSVFIGKLMRVATTQNFSSLHQKKKIIFILSGGISAFCWIGIILAAKQLGV